MQVLRKDQYGRIVRRVSLQRNDPTFLTWYPYRLAWYIRAHFHGSGDATSARRCSEQAVRISHTREKVTAFRPTSSRRRFFLFFSCNGV